MIKPITVDFETFAIKARPEYPPKPTSVSIIEPGRAPVFLAWGHPSENNCTFTKAKQVLKKVWNDKRPKLFHHAKFDMDVYETHFNGRQLAWHEFHDTMYLAFLHNPHDDKLSLKPLADKYLDMHPEEQDAVKEYIIKHVFLTQKGGAGDVKLYKMAQAKAPAGLFKCPPTKTGAFIAYAPGGLVGTYANGDTIRTRKLFDLFMPYILERGMLEAYDRERRIMRPLLQNEREGIHTSKSRLLTDTKKYTKDIKTVDAWLAKKLKCKGLEVDKTEQLADALDKAGFITEWVMTKPTKNHPNGQRSMAKDNVEACVNDKSIINVLQYRSKLANSVRNFLIPWEKKSKGNNGFINTTWNQVRQPGERGKGTKGARTGRLSSNNPSLMNVTNNPIILNSKVNKSLELDEQLVIPSSLLKSINQLPILRGYITPDKGQMFLNRDFNSQELRVLGHFEDGILKEAYAENPMLDIHALAQQLINEMLKLKLKRKPIKNLGFGIIYGMGLALLAKSMGVDDFLARKIKRAYLEIFPGLGYLIDDLMERGKNDEPIKTWGGREYYVEPPKMVQGRMWTFEYKLLNILIQGSSADGTKQAIINYDEARKHGRFVLTVHDEIMVSAEKPQYKSEMKILQDCMLDLDFDVPMISEGKYGSVNWATMKAYKD